MFVSYPYKSFAENPLLPRTSTGFAGVKWRVKDPAMQNESEERKRDNMGKSFLRRFGGFVLMVIDEVRRRTRDAIQVVKNLLFGDKEMVSSIEIRGNRKFCEVIRKALLFLKEKDMSIFDLIDKHLYLIVQSGETTLLEPDPIIGALALGEKEIEDNTPTWLACLRSI